METLAIVPPHTEMLEFRSSGIHGLGAFARQRIRSGTMIIEYVGVRIDKAESLRRCFESNEYIFRLDDAFDLDGNVGWNPAKYINHSCDPNCDAEMIDGQIWIAARRDIEPGEEITFNYGYDLDGFEEHPCCCRAANCVGYIVAEEFHDDVRRRTAAGEVTREVESIT